MADTDTTTRFCKKCGEHKPPSEFYNQRQRKDGLSFYCKECKKSEAKRWRNKDPERARLLDAARCEKSKERRIEQRRARYLADAEKFRHQKRLWTSANKDSVSESGRKYYAANADRIRARAAEYHAANRDRSKIYSNNRRARKQAAGGTLSKGLAERLYKLQRGKCACCGEKLGDNYHMDHIMPLALGGTNEDSNIQLLRQSCNNQKHAKHPVDFMQQRGFLL